MRPKDSIISATIQTYNNSRKKILIGIIGLFVLLVINQSCQKFELIAIDNTIALQPNLSDYHIFKGNPIDLTPADEFELYELATTLFTDYAEKQRLIKLPVGTKMTVNGDGLPDFPDGTILVKTFYYFHDKRNPGLGKQLLETRMLIKAQSKWSVGTYVWNKEQTEAILQTNGYIQNINWIDETGKNNTINYHIPGNTECTTCHQSGYSTLPIGPKLRNLNRNVLREGKQVNQLDYFQKMLMLDRVNSGNIDKLPDWQSPAFTLEERARAYFEVNCAHCHNNNGFAARTDLFFTYEATANHTQIAKKKKKIVSKMSASTIRERMPKLGTTIIDEQGLQLIKAYLDTL